MLKPNIGILNALIRITCGFTFLAFGTARLIRRPWRDGSFLVIILSAMKVAEGIVRYCPVVDLMDNKDVSNMVNRFKKDQGGQQETSNESTQQ